MKRVVIGPILTDLDITVRSDCLENTNPNTCVQAAPEPGTLMLLGVGLFGLPFVRRRKRGSDRLRAPTSSPEAYKQSPPPLA
jgi:hypothetical protein